MRFTDWIVQKIGSDKVMRFLGGAWITSLFSPIGWIGILFGVILTLVLSIIKERYLDSEFDFKDIIAAGTGCATSVVLYLILISIV